jgi:23S rRNA pseudouridine1911/1915/1917 synthase
VETIRLEADTEYVRIDVFTGEHLPGLSRSGRSEAVGTRPCREKWRTSAEKPQGIERARRLDVMLPEPVMTKTQAQDIPLDIVYEDRDVIVVNKPRGMVVHPSPGHSSGDPCQRAFGPLRRQPVRHRR